MMARPKSNRTHALNLRLSPHIWEKVKEIAAIEGRSAAAQAEYFLGLACYLWSQDQAIPGEVKYRHSREASVD